MTSIVPKSQNRMGPPVVPLPHIETFNKFLCAVVPGQDIAVIEVIRLIKAHLIAPYQPITKRDKP